MTNFITCNLSSVVTLDIVNSNVVDVSVWQANSLCCGTRGIFPRMLSVRSSCLGPEKCCLLEEGVLLYPPDKFIWLPMLALPIWKELAKKFQSLPEVYSEYKAFVKENQLKWGVGPFLKKE